MSAPEAVKPLLTVERRERISALVQQRGVVRVSELSDLFDVSGVTIRSDLDAMASEGRLQRNRGGAVAVSSPSLTVAFEQRAGVNLEAKRRIGRAAADLVRPHDRIILDSGTTVMEMAKCLYNHGPITVVTNALNVATQVGVGLDVDVVVAGGSLHRGNICTLGPQAERALADVVVNKAFLGTYALDLDVGLTDLSIELASVKQAMTRAARQVILLADSSKWGTVGFAKVLPLSGVHICVSDTNLPLPARAAMERLGIEVLLV
jgi:DeoR/GlpR family transcriptional regulator of sugar metabolism